MRRQLGEESHPISRLRGIITGELLGNRMTGHLSSTGSCVRVSLTCLQLGLHASTACVYVCKCVCVRAHTLMCVCIV